MTVNDLRIFLTDTMSMSEVYQPVIIKQLLLAGGKSSKEELATRLADNDESVQEYYRKILMRWPKETLTNHKVVSYDRSTREFSLTLEADPENIDGLIQLCDHKIAEWLASKHRTRSKSGVNSSKRYEILKAAKGKCQLCGVPSGLRPIDVDHIIPKAKANKYGKIVVNGKPIEVDSMENLQALCFRCNRAKRDEDDTDWRKTQILVRDRVPNQIREEGRHPIVRKLHGRELSAALKDRLVEEVAEFLSTGNVEELADIYEVLSALVRDAGLTSYDVERVRETKVRDSGGFEEGWYYEGDT